MGSLSTTLLLLILATLSTASGWAAKFNWTTTKYVYAFGDSYTFVEGTRGLATFRCRHVFILDGQPWFGSKKLYAGVQPSFIGDRFNFGFTPEELLSNEIVPKNVSTMPDQSSHPINLYAIPADKLGRSELGASEQSCSEVQSIS